MANRRSLGDAMSITADKMAFIQGGKTTAEPAPQKPASPITETPAVMKAAEVAAEPEETREVIESEKPTRAPTRRGRERSRSRDESNTSQVTFAIANLMVPFTTRLRPATSAALKRAGLEQRLRGASPATVQEIAEIAIADWLEQHDYL